MPEATVSTDYQVTIPKEIRRQIPLKPGQGVRVVANNGVIILTPQRPLRESPGSSKGMKTGTTGQQQVPPADVHSQEVRTLAAAQGVKVVDSLETLCGGWPEDQLDDGFEVAVRQWRDDELESGE